jgi:hypothetical protein
MKLELLVFGITAFLIANTYHDGKYTKMLMISKKYVKMAMFAFVGFSLYLFIKKHPDKSKSMLTHANSLIKYMPVDRDTADLISPLFDFTNTKRDLDNLSTNPNNIPYSQQPPQMKRMMQSGGNSTKRCVSETKKKYVAAQQGWKCMRCGEQLSATFEVDHKIDLRYGGTNHVSNLHALCRNCHGDKTAEHNLQ